MSIEITKADIGKWVVMPMWHGFHIAEIIRVGKVQINIKGRSGYSSRYRRYVPAVYCGEKDAAETLALALTEIEKAHSAEERRINDQHAEALKRAADKFVSDHGGRVS